MIADSATSTLAAGICIPHAFVVIYLAFAEDEINAMFFQNLISAKTTFYNYILHKMKLFILFFSQRDREENLYDCHPSIERRDAFLMRGVRHIRISCCEFHYRRDSIRHLSLGIAVR